MKIHLSLPTRDIKNSIAFYDTLLNSKPTKQYDDYALYLMENPGLELALTLDSSAKEVQDGHYGVAVESRDLVRAAIERLRLAGLPVDIEIGETCCYAIQDKVWATDPDGRRWETYFVVAESEERESENMTCCQESAQSASCCPA